MRSRRLWTGPCLAAAVVAAMALAGPSAGRSQQLPTARPFSGQHSRIPKPAISIAPSVAELHPGGRIALVARPSGGEAILFSVTWTILEGGSGGSLDVRPARRVDGTYTAIYTAPLTPGGTIHVVAALREMPSVEAVATIRVLDR